MRTTLLLILIGSATAFAQQFEGADTTNTQAVLRFTGITDAGACRLSITDTAGKLIRDSDPALYPDAQSGLRPGNVLDGSTLYFVVGKRTYELASDNRSYSRALQTATN